jgi:hypothetical protein
MQPQYSHQKPQKKAQAQEQRSKKQKILDPTHLSQIGTGAKRLEQWRNCASRRYLPSRISDRQGLLVDSKTERSDSQPLFHLSGPFSKIEFLYYSDR